MPPGPSPEDINAGLSEPRTSFDAHQQLYWECALQTPAIIARDFEYLACHGLEAPGVREWRSVRPVAALQFVHCPGKAEKKAALVLLGELIPR